MAAAAALALAGPAMGFARPASGRWARAATSLAALALLALAPATARAHSAEATRSVRLQFGPGGVEGLLVYRLPPGPAARLLLGVPQGLLPGEHATRNAGGKAAAQHTASGPTAEEILGARAAPEALRGLRAAVGPETALPAAAPPRLLEAKARRTRGGGVEALLLVRFADRAPSAGEVLFLEAESGLPLRATLSAAEGTRLSLRKGVGRATEGGVALRPRPGRACLVLVEAK